MSGSTRDVRSENPPSVAHGRQTDDLDFRNAPDAKSKISLSELPLTKNLAWEIESISVYLKEIHQIWASALSISHPQLKILMALSESNGAAVSAVAKMIHVEASFVTNQSKALEKRGLLHRRPSSIDGRVVELSLTESSHRQLEKLTGQQMALDEFILKGFAADQTANFMTVLSALRRRIEKVRHRAALDCVAAVLPSRSC